MNKSEVFITDDDNELMNKVNTLANENKATRKKREITNEEKERLLENLRRGRETSKNNRLEKQKQLVAPPPPPPQNNPNEILDQLMKRFENLEAKLTKPAEEKKPEVKQEVKAPEEKKPEEKKPEVKQALFVPPAPQVKPVEVIKKPLLDYNKYNLKKSYKHF